ncbi:MAG: hypothetical protein A2017_00705 [Lentisphaerae bacterium GWF2_44_16]|nr:MAG: hypothetical protein A2017_00705 [Lentisphaerae bacterium GWF2_44_16]
MNMIFNFMGFHVQKYNALKTLCIWFLSVITITSLAGDKGPICYLRFDEGDGFNEDERVHVMDFSGSGNSGKLQLNGAYPKRTEGKYGLGLLFTEKEQSSSDKGACVMIPNMDKYDFSKGLTVEAWIKLPKNNTASAPDIIMSNASGSRKAGFRFEVKGETLSFLFDSGIKGTFQGASSVPAKNPLTRDVWHHAAGTYDGKTFKVYVDGVEAGNGTAGQAVSKGGSTMFLGVLTAEDSCGFDGFMDEIKIYDYARAPEGIAEDMKQMSTVESAAAVWKYDISGMDIADIAKRLKKNNFYKDTPITEAAQQYNMLLMKTSFAEKRLLDIERISFHLGITPSEELRKNFNILEESLNETWLAYGKLFREFRDSARFNGAPFTKACGKTETIAEAFETKLDKTEQALHSETMKKAGWAMPQKWGRQPRSIPPFQASGKANRILVGVWGSNPFPGDEKHPQENEFELQTNSLMTAVPAAGKENEWDFSNITKTVNDFKDKGHSSFCMLPYGGPSTSYAPEWFNSKHASDPEIILHSSDGEMPKGYEIKNSLVQVPQAEQKRQTAKLNWYHPDVRALMKLNIASLASTCKNIPLVDMPFYEHAAEIHNVMDTPKGWRKLGYGIHAADSFRMYLKKKYETIEKLNAAWQSSYRTFDEIQQPEDRWVKGGEKQKYKEITPIYADFEAFREASLIDWMKDIYDTLKANDPGRPVAARHSNLLKWVNGARIFETCDILECHTFAPSMQVNGIYMASLLKLHKDKSLAYLEDFWGAQQEKGRISEEKVQRRGLDKHVSQTFAWGRTLQLKWYAYTFGAYIWTYNGNWMDPRQDFTILRYCAPSLIIAKRKMEEADWMLTHTEMAKSRILLLQPSSSIRNGACSRDETLVAVHGALYPKNYIYELLPEEYLMNGKISLEDFDVLILPSASYLPPAVSEQLSKWVRGGGTLIAVEKAGIYTDLGIKDGSLLKDLLAMNWDTQITPPKKNEPPLIRNAGKGKVLIISSTTQLQQKETQSILFKTLDASTQRQAWAENNSFEILMRYAEDGSIYLFILNPNPDETLSDTVIVPKEIREAVDMNFSGGCPITLDKSGTNEETRFRMRLGPCESIFVYCPSAHK